MVMSNRFELAKHYNEKYKDQLARCKYCGNTASIVSDKDYFFGKGKGVVWSVCCDTDKCDCTAEDTSVKRVIEKWNERHSKKEI